MLSIHEEVRVCVGIKINVLCQRRHQVQWAGVNWVCITLLAPHAQAYSGTFTNSSVSSKHSTFRNHFRTEHQGRSQREPKHQQRSSICCTAWPDTKALSQKTYIFTHSVLAQRKAHSTVFQMYLSWCYQTQTKTFKLKKPSVPFFPTKNAIYLLIDWVSGDWSTCATDSLCVLLHRLSALCPLGRKSSLHSPCFPTRTRQMINEACACPGLTGSL